MKHAILAVLLAMILLPLQAVAEGVEAELAAMEQRFSDAIRRDPSALEELLDPGFYYNTAEGTTLGKAALIAHLRANRLQLGEFRREQERVRVAGDTGVVSAVTRTQAVVNGVPRDIASRHLHVWLRGPEGWRLAARQVTYVAPRASGP